MSMLPSIRKGIFLTLCALCFHACTPTHATLPSKQSPLPDLSRNQHQYAGRILFTSAGKRYQMQMQWQEIRPEQGILRLSHAASGRIIDVQWHKTFSHSSVQWRDNQAESQAWQTISANMLEEKGILLMPWELSHMFKGTLPATFKSRDGAWIGHIRAQYITMQWLDSRRMLNITSLQQGKQVSFIFDE